MSIVYYQKCKAARRAKRKILVLRSNTSDEVTTVDRRETEGLLYVTRYYNCLTVITIATQGYLTGLTFKLLSRAAKTPARHR